MYSLEVVITAALIAVIIGVIAGVVFSQRKTFSVGAQREMEKHLAELQQQQQNYQQEVTEHFTQTAALLDQLSESYRDVHNHLARGAHKLAGNDASSKLSLLPEAGKKELSEDDLRHISPPLDYAPKSAYSKGVLHEEFTTDVDTANDGDDTEDLPSKVKKSS